MIAKAKDHQILNLQEEIERLKQTHCQLEKELVAERQISAALRTERDRYLKSLYQVMKEQHSKEDWERWAETLDQKGFSFEEIMAEVSSLAWVKTKGGGIASGMAVS